MTEVCKNPFRKRKCTSGEPVVVFITNDKIPICRKCWDELADSDAEWEA